MRISSTATAISKKVCVQKSPLLEEFSKVSFFFLKSVLEPYGVCSMRLQRKTTPCVSHALCSFARVTQLRDKRGWSVSQCAGCGGPLLKRFGLENSLTLAAHLVL